MHGPCCRLSLHRRMARVVLMPRLLVRVVTAGALVGALLGLPASSASSADRAFIRMSLPFDGRFAGVAAIAVHNDTWWAAGSFVDATGQHRPGLWRSYDTQTWSRIPTAPITGYGEISELYSVAVSQNGLVAIGAATGGAHGNPRTVSWVLRPDNVLQEVAAGFELYNGPRQIAVRAVSAAPNGWVIIGARNNQNNRLGATSWTSTTGEDFVIHDDEPALSSQPGEQIIGLDVTRQGDRLIAVGERGVPRKGAIDTDGIAWTSNDGATWTRWSPRSLTLGGRNAERAQRVAVFGSRIVIGGTVTDTTKTRFVAWTTLDGVAWHRSSLPQLGKSADVLSNVTGVAANGHKLFVAARVGGRLRLVASSNGQRWHSLALPPDLPHGARSRLTLATSDTNTSAVLLVGATDPDDGGGLWRLAPVPSTLPPAPSTLPPAPSTLP